MDSEETQNEHDDMLSQLQNLVNTVWHPSRKGQCGLQWKTALQPYGHSQPQTFRRQPVAGHGSGSPGSTEADAGCSSRTLGIKKSAVPPREVVGNLELSAPPQDVVGCRRER